MIVKNLYPFTNVGPSSLASTTLEVGYRILGIMLKLSGTTYAKSDIERIFLKYNGKIFYDITGSDLDTINTFRGLTAETDTLYIDFTEPFAKTLGGMYQGGIDTARGIVAGGLTLQVQIGSGVSADFALDGYIEMIEPLPLDSPIPRISGLIKHVISPAAAGKFPVRLPHGQDAKHLVKGVHFMGSTVTAVGVKKNGLILHEDIPSAVNDSFHKRYKLVPQSNHYCYIPTANHDMSRVLVTENARDLVFDTTVSGAGNVTIYSHVLGHIENF